MILTVLWSVPQSAPGLVWGDNTPSPSSASKYIVSCLCGPPDDVCVYSCLFSCLKLVFATSSWLYRNLQANLLLHFWPQSKISSNIWFCFISYFCVLVTCNYQHVLFWHVINFLDMCIKAFSFIFSLCSRTVDLNDSYVNMPLLTLSYYYLIILSYS